MTMHSPLPGNRQADRGHLLMLAQYYWPEIIGSAPYCTDLAEWFAAQGYRVTVIAARPGYPSPEQFPSWQDGSRDREIHNGVTIERIASSSRAGAGMFGRLYGDLRFALSVARRHLRTSHQGPVISFVPSILSAIAGRHAAGSRHWTMAVIHDIESGLAAALGIARLKPVVHLMRWLERQSLARVDQVVVLSEAMKREIAAFNIGTPIHVIPIWVQEPPSLPARPPAAQTVMYSGNLGKKQNLDQLLPMMAQFAQTSPRTTFVFQGDGSERERLARELGGLDNVKFRPLVPVNELLASLQSADVHLVPQASNVAAYAIPSKIYSIMSAGRPFVAIADSASPLREIAESSGGGLCVAQGDGAALASAVERLLADPALAERLGDNGRRYVQQNMGRDAVMGQYQRLLFDPLAAQAPVRGFAAMSR